MIEINKKPGDSIHNLHCYCGESRTFEVGAYELVCSRCGRDFYCTPPIVGIFVGRCSCGPERTFVVDEEGNRICSRCGLYR